MYFGKFGKIVETEPDFNNGITQSKANNEPSDNTVLQVLSTHSGWECNSQT